LPGPEGEFIERVRETRFAGVWKRSSIFDSQGRLVEQLMSQKVTGSGRRVRPSPTGVYFAVPGARLKTTEGVKVLYLR
jgi:hypothetical protein